MDRGIWMIEKLGTEQPQKTQAGLPRRVMEESSQGGLTARPIAPTVPELDGSRLEPKLRDAVAGWKKSSAMPPRRRPLSDAEQNERARMLDRQKEQLLKESQAREPAPQRQRPPAGVPVPQKTKQHQEEE